ncbi:MAG: peptide-methionine (S)-S-oxide reductase MsrA [Nitrospirota bacterium]|nr:peptide-methionine (S)-S-oxide reductase MsrA [Nitrospirota bacterium]
MSGDPAGDATGPTAVATFAGGCFWCMEGPFDVLNGVISTTAGYIGGHTKNPTYQQVSAGGTGHAEAVQVRYDPREITYGELLEVYWRNVDPVTLNRQFCDGGTQYRSAIFFHTPEQEAAARASRDALDASGRFDRPVVTEVAPATVFYPAEDYHQDFYVHNPIRYKFYRYNCGRDRRLEELWGEESHHG